MSPFKTIDAGNMYKLSTKCMASILLSQKLTQRHKNKYDT